MVHTANRFGPSSTALPVHIALFKGQRKTTLTVQQTFSLPSYLTNASVSTIKLSDECVVRGAWRVRL